MSGLRRGTPLQGEPPGAGGWLRAPPWLVGPAFLFLFRATSVVSPRLLSPCSVLPLGPSFGSFPFPAPFFDPQLRLASLATLPPAPSTCPLSTLTPSQDGHVLCR